MTLSQEDEIVLRVNTPPHCARCGGGTLLHVEFLHPWSDGHIGSGHPRPRDVPADTPRGEENHVLREAVLCPVCDHGEPAADGLLAFLAVHATLQPAQLDAFHTLVAVWVDVLRGRRVNEGQLNDEYERWRAGDL
ncbi:DUF6300 family protein [Streptomyces sp. NPDC057908]|uniref:DUF6300 family protein n=1 Tax=Streptomyces sp. NPDC057908 TaxID=3346276 RepID=UPI0036E4C6B6